MYAVQIIIVLYLRWNHCRKSKNKCDEETNPCYVSILKIGQLLIVQFLVYCVSGLVLVYLLGHVKVCSYAASVLILC